MRECLTLVLCPDGRTRDLADASEKYGILETTIRARVRRGLDTEEVFDKDLKAKPRSGPTGILRVPPACLVKRTKAECTANLIKLDKFEPTKLDKEMSKYGTVEYGQVRAR